MFKKMKVDGAESVEVCGIPFDIAVNDKGVPEKLGDTNRVMGEACDVLFFLGMSTDSDFSSEWWSQNEAMYDHSVRVFLGDRLAEIHITYTDRSEELVSVIFGVNCWNYNLYYRPKPEEGLMCFEAPYQEPFKSDEHARALKDKVLKLRENTADDAMKATKFVFAYRVDPQKVIKDITFIKSDSKRANVAISAVTGIKNEPTVEKEWEDLITDRDFFLGRQYFSDLDALSRRLYQYKDELPEHDSKKEITGFDAPDITFIGAPMAEVYTNVYRYNIMDMAYKKLEDDGRSHTSSACTNNFGCYLGFGTFVKGVDSYGGHVWTRDIGRTLMEILNAGYFERVEKGAEYLEKLLYYPTIRFNTPHWKRVANIYSEDGKDLWNEGNENDGHAAVMLFMYSMFRKGAVDKTWLLAHRQALKDAAEYYFWQKEHSDITNFSDILYSHSETSKQIYGGYDLFSNIISSYALLGYSRLFEAMGEHDYSTKLSDFSAELRRNAVKHFTLRHPRFGDVLTDTTDDCWTYEYKRMCDLLIFSDMFGYDMAEDNPELFDLMDRTFSAQKESFYNPFSGRQMGYGQGYLTQSAIMLDRFTELTECINAAAALCYHHTDVNYIVPEGVIMHGDGRYWFRNSDQGNAVQQAETVKCARLLVGIDDILPERGLRLIPRLPDGWKSLDCRGYVTAGRNGICKTDFSYLRLGSEGPEYSHTVTASDSTGEGFRASWNSGEQVEVLRIGPFKNGDISAVGGSIEKICEISGRFFAYIRI